MYSKIKGLLNKLILKIKFGSNVSFSGIPSFIVGTVVHGNISTHSLVTANRKLDIVRITCKKGE